MRRYFSIRANGSTLHNDPDKTNWYYPFALPEWPERSFDYVDRCLHESYARIGWPHVGDLSGVTGLADVPSQTDAYSVIKDTNRKQLLSFRGIRTGDVIVLPRSGQDTYYIGNVTREYHWHFSRPEDPFESAHRVGVSWDITTDGAFAEYTAGDMKLGRNGTPFALALCRITKQDAVEAIDGVRAAKAGRIKAIRLAR